MKRQWFAALTALLLAIMPIAALATDSPIALKGGPGPGQIYLKIGEVVVTADGPITTAYEAKNRQYTLAKEGIAEIFYAGRYVISYSNFPEKGHHYWYSYNVDTGKISYKIIPWNNSPFWGDDKGLYYADYATKPNIFRYSPKTGKSTKLLSSVTGQPRGYIDGRLICMDFRNNRVISYDSQKNLKVLYSSKTGINDATVVNQKIFISRSDGLYRLVNGKLRLLYDQYAPILAIVEPYFINATSDSDDGVLASGTLTYYLNDTKNNRYGEIGSIETGPTDGYLMSPGLSKDGTRMAFNRFNQAMPFYEFSMPTTAEMRAY